jgi:hypothetical protein
MYQEHAKPFFEITAKDYSTMTADQQASVMTNFIGKDFVFEVSAKVVKDKTTINILKAHPATRKRPRVILESSADSQKRLKALTCSDHNTQGLISVCSNHNTQGLISVCYDCAWLSLTALSTVTRNLWL